MTEKRDWLGECNNYKVSVEDFEAAFCQRCMAPDCSRSNAGKSRFEQRVHNWHQRLFEQPARMPEDDPRLIQIRAKRFVDLPTGSVPEIGRAPTNAWLDPRDFDEPAAHASLPAPSLPAPVTPPIVFEAPQALPAETKPVGSVVAPAQILNTPRPPAQMLGGAAPPGPSPVVDKWAAKPTTETADATKVKPGARIRFGGT